MFYYDPTYLIILPAFVFALWASIRVNSTFKKYQTLYCLSGHSAATAARAVLDRYGLYDVRIEHVSGELTDHFDPSENVIRLSDSVYHSRSAAAIGVACHEAGHAVQHAENYLPIKIRQALVPITNFGSQAGIWLFVIGVLLTYFSETFVIIGYVGVALFSLTALFQLVTLPTEFNASRRAIKAIREENILDPQAMAGAKKVLNAAALTYVAALAVTFSQILRFLIILAGSRRRDD